MKKHLDTSKNTWYYIQAFANKLFKRFAKKKAKNKLKKFLTSSWVCDILNELLNKTTKNLDN